MSRRFVGQEFGNEISPNLFLQVGDTAPRLIRQSSHIVPTAAQEDLSRPVIRI